MGPPTYRCPSDPNQPAIDSPAFTNYAMCYGDAVQSVGYEPGAAINFRDQIADTTSQRGAFVNGQLLKFDDFTDGLSETMVMAETATFGGKRRSGSE